MAKRNCFEAILFFRGSRRVLKRVWHGLARRVCPAAAPAVVPSSVGRRGATRQAGAGETSSMWSWLPDELLQRIVQLVAERAPRSLAILALLDQRSRSLAAARLTCMKPLLTSPFSLTVQQIFSGTGAERLNLFNHALRSEHMEVFGGALVSGALASLEKLFLNLNAIGDDGMSALASACASGALAQCTSINLSWNRIGDAGLSALAGALSSGALPQLKDLRLAGNQIGGIGVSALADAVGKGALASLETLAVDDDEHPALEAACQARGVDLQQ